MMRRSLSAIAALVLTVSAAHAAGVVEADDKLLVSIESLIKRSKTEKLSSGELNQLHSLVVQAEDKVMPSWRGASLDEIAKSKTGQLWKEGNTAILDQVQRTVAQRTGTLGFMPSGKSFMDNAFDPRSSDYDLTVLGPRSPAGAEEFEKAAPPGFLERRKFSVMSADGNFTRYRGSPETAGKPLTVEQMKAGRDKGMMQTATQADSTGSYLSRGSMGHLESQVASRKYAGEVTFYSSVGDRIGTMPLAKFGSMAERFGVVENHLGDVLGMAADNDAQLANYLTQKGQILGSAKVLQRQSEVVARLPQNLRDELMKDRQFARLLQDADEVSAAMKTGMSAAEAIKKTGLTEEEFTRRARAASERVVQAAGRDLVLNVGPGADAAARTGARLMVEQNLLGAIANSGGVDRFRELHAGNKPLLTMLDDVARAYGEDNVAKLAQRRAAALAGGGVAAAAWNAGIPEAALLDLIRDPASVAGKAAAKTARGMVAEMVAGMGIDVAIATYQLMHGDGEGAARSLAEGGITYMMPQAGLALVVKDLVRASMELAVEQLIVGPLVDARVARVWSELGPAIVENRDNIRSMITGATSPNDQALMNMLEEHMQNAGLNSRELDPKVRKVLIDQLFAMRGQLIAEEKFAEESQKRAKAAELQRKIEDTSARNTMIAVSADLERSDERSRQHTATQPPDGTISTTPAVPRTPPSGNSANTPRAWLIPPDQPSTTVPVQPAQPKSPSSIVSRQIEADRAAKQQHDAAEIARLDGMCKCFFETQYQNDCVTGEARARTQSKEWEGRCEIKEPARYDAEAKKCVGYFVRYWRAHAYDDMKSYKSGYGYLKWPTVPTYCGTRQ